VDLAASKYDPMVCLSNTIIKDSEQKKIAFLNQANKYKHKKLPTEYKTYAVKIKIICSVLHLV
jgi:hypothetical protein